MAFKIKHTQPGDIHHGEFSHTIYHEESGHVIAGLRTHDSTVAKSYGCHNTEEEIKIVFDKYLNGELPELSESYSVPEPTPEVSISRSYFGSVDTSGYYENSTAGL